MTRAAIGGKTRREEEGKLVHLFMRARGSMYLAELRDKEGEIHW
jgi:hypothetical protein